MGKDTLLVSVLSFYLKIANGNLESKIWKMKSFRLIRPLLASHNNYLVSCKSIWSSV